MPMRKATRGLALTERPRSKEILPRGGFERMQAVEKCFRVGSGVVRGLFVFSRGIG